MIINFLSACEDSNVLSVIYLAKTVLEFITSILVPVILILMLSIDLGKIVLSGKEEDMKKSVKGIVSKVIGAALVYFVPVFVNLLFSLMNMSTNNIVTCFNNATAEYIEFRSSEEKAQKEFEKQEIALEQQAAKEERERLAAEREEIRKENEKTAEEKRQEAASAIGEADTSNQAGPITSSTIVSISVQDLAVPLYYSDHKTVFKTLSVNQQVSTQMHNILNNISEYVKENSDLIPRFETAGLYVAKAGYHGRGLAIDLFNNWTYTRGGTTYSPYSSQGVDDWNRYKKFICEVCDGQEDCKYNINYIIFEKFFKGNGWCWGGNWGPSSFDPMHFELRDGGCLTSNKQSVTC